MITVTATIATHVSKLINFSKNDNAPQDTRFTNN